MRRKKKTTILIIFGFLFLLLFVFSFPKIRPKNWQENFPNEKIKSGDLIFHTSTSAQSKAIQLATKSKYSHMGIIFQKDKKFYVLEAVSPVKLTSLQNWIQRGKNQHYVVKRLKNAEKILTAQTLKKMQFVGKKYWGKDYDLYFEWSDKRMYCSELVWKIYKEATNIEIGKLEKLSDFDLSHPTVAKKLYERYQNNIPLDEKVISPATMFRSPRLFTVKTN